MHERRNRRRFIVPVILLIAALGLGVVYAATTGVLNFSGTAVVGENTDIWFEDYYVEPYDERDSLGIENNSKTLRFTLHLDGYGSTKTVSARVYNNGNVPVTLGNLTTTSSAPSDITVTWPSQFNGLRLEPGDYSDYYDIVVKWTGSSAMVPGSYDFSATLNYTQTT